MLEGSILALRCQLRVAATCAIVLCATGVRSASAEEFSASNEVYDRTPIASLAVIGWNPKSHQLLVFSEDSSKKTSESFEVKGSLLIVDSITGKVDRAFRGVCESSVPIGRGTASGYCTETAELKRQIAGFSSVQAARQLNFIAGKDGVLALVDGQVVKLAQSPQLFRGKPGACKPSDVFGEASKEPGGVGLAVVVWSKSKHCKLKRSQYGEHGLHLFVVPLGGADVDNLNRVGPSLTPGVAVTAGTAANVLKGTIGLADAVKGDIKAGSVLFIIVRKDAGEGQRGTLIAAKRIEVRGADQFPIAYEVSAADVIMQGAALKGAVRVEARVDQDGDALSKSPGDVTGHSPATTVGGPVADVTLDTRI